MAVLLMDAREKSFDFAQEVTKQLLALSTGVITITVTFLSDVVGDEPVNAFTLRLSWILLLISIALGIAALMAMAGSLSRNPNANIYDLNIAIPAGLQILTFLAGLGAAVCFASGLLA